MTPPAADVERRHLAVLLVVVVATGIVDAACLLHLGTFTAYLTGAVILFGARLVGATGSAVPSAIAIASFLVGAVVGARLVRRRVARNRQMADLLLVVAALVGVAAVVAGVAGVGEEVGDDVGARVTIAVLALAMGAQMAVIRAAGVTDVVMAAVTGVTFSLVADSPVGGGHPRRTGRRVGVVAALFGGAVAGAGVARWAPWAAWALAAVVLAGAAVLAWATLPRTAGDAGGR